MLRLRLQAPAKINGNLQQSGAAESVSSQRPRMSNIDIDETHVLADGTHSAGQSKPGIVTSILSP